MTKLKQILAFNVMAVVAIVSSTRMLIAALTLAFSVN